jgi:hypothetical protein
MNKFHGKFEEAYDDSYEPTHLPSRSKAEEAISELSSYIAERSSTRYTNLISSFHEENFPGLSKRMLSFMEDRKNLFIVSPYFDWEYCSSWKLGREVSYECLTTCPYIRWVDILGPLCDERVFTNKRNSFLLKHSMGYMLDRVDEYSYPKSIDAVKNSIRGFFKSPKQLLISGESELKKESYESFWRRLGVSIRFGGKAEYHGFVRPIPETIEYIIADSHFIFFSHPEQQWLNGEILPRVKPLLKGYGKSVIRIDKDMFVAIPNNLVDITHYPFNSMRYKIHTSETLKEFTVFQTPLNVPGYGGSIERIPTLYGEYY